MNWVHVSPAAGRLFRNIPIPESVQNTCFLKMLSGQFGAGKKYGVESGLAVSGDAVAHLGIISLIRDDYPSVVVNLPRVLHYLEKMRSHFDISLLTLVHFPLCFLFLTYVSESFQNCVS